MDLSNAENNEENKMEDKKHWHIKELVQVYKNSYRTGLSIMDSTKELLLSVAAYAMFVLIYGLTCILHIKFINTIDKNIYFTLKIGVTWLVILIIGWKLIIGLSVIVRIRTGTDSGLWRDKFTNAVANVYVYSVIRRAIDSRKLYKIAELYRCEIYNAYFLYQPRDITNHTKEDKQVIRVGQYGRMYELSSNKLFNKEERLEIEDILKKASKLHKEDLKIKFISGTKEVTAEYRNINCGIC